jgi:hypothetical protein
VTKTTRTTTKPANAGDLLGSFRNVWRNRFVEIYADSDDPNGVVTVGRSLSDERADPIVTREPRYQYQRWIGRFNQVYE